MKGLASLLRIGAAVLVGVVHFKSRACPCGGGHPGGTISPASPPREPDAAEREALEAAWRATGEAELESLPAGDRTEIYRVIRSDHYECFWWIATLRLTEEGGRLDLRELSPCGPTPASPRSVSVDAATARAFRKSARDLGFWEGVRKSPDPATAGWYRVVVNPQLIEGARAGTSRRYYGRDALDLRAWDRLGELLHGMGQDEGSSQ